MRRLHSRLPGTRFLPLLLTTAVLAAVTATTSAMAQTSPVPSEDARLLTYASPGQRVDIGGRKINLNCTGSGRSTVILLAGIGSWSPVWYKVQPLAAQKARVCSFDRASYGFSDPAPRPQVLSDVVEDLHAALNAASLPGPYVLVGHSYGGVEARLYAQRWRQDVAGMVLVDTSPASEGLIDAQQPDFEAVVGQERLASNRLYCALRLMRGPLDPSTPDYKICTAPLPVDAPAALRKVWPDFYTPDQAASQVSLLASMFTRKYDSVDRQDLGDLPLVVLSAENTWSNGLPAGLRFAQAYQPIWYGMHASLAKLSSRGSYRIVSGSNHEIQLEKPEAVFEAIEEVLRETPAG